MLEANKLFALHQIKTIKLCVVSQDKTFKSVSRTTTPSTIR